MNLSTISVNEITVDFCLLSIKLAGLGLRTVSLDAILGAHAAASKEL